MNAFYDFFQRLLDTSSYPPRWQCGDWSDFAGWLYIISNLLIWLAYFIIPVILIFSIRQGRQVPFPRLIWLFGAFILLCGSTHLLDALIFWWPVYRLNGLLLGLTALVSLATAFTLMHYLPEALRYFTEYRPERATELQESETRLRQEIEDRDIEIELLREEIAALRSPSS